MLSRWPRPVRDSNPADGVWLGSFLAWARAVLATHRCEIEEGTMAARCGSTGIAPGLIMSNATGEHCNADY
jgi:hypothetical protein